MNTENLAKPPIRLPTPLPLPSHADFYSCTQTRFSDVTVTANCQLST